MPKIAVIGGGIVGSTAAYYLSQKPDVRLTLFDDNQGQATKAAAGIICPWFSKRRNKAWYRLSNRGAHFYPELLADMAKHGLSSKAYEKKTTWIVKNKAKTADDLIEIAKKRQVEAPLIQEIAKLTPEQIRDKVPQAQTQATVIATDAGAIVDGQALCQDLQDLLQAQGGEIIQERAQIETITDNSLTINDRDFDAAILAVGAWLPELLHPHGYNVDVRPQKGQLAVYQNQAASKDLPLIMLDGEGDIIPHHHGQIFIGASHEDDMGFDLTVDPSVLAAIEKAAAEFLPAIENRQAAEIKVGTRAYTSDYAPFFGQLADHSHIAVASGLGSSGLTSGPLIGKELAQLISGQPTEMTLADYDVSRYVAKQ